MAINKFSKIVKVEINTTLIFFENGFYNFDDCYFSKSLSPIRRGEAPTTPILRLIML